ncbi:MAG: hypothetical protein OCD76_21660 [Reichenbachiella sp.]
MKLLNLSNKPSESLLTLLDRNIIGTPGESILYQQKDTRNKIDLIQKPHFLNLERNNQVIATACFCERKPIHEDHTTLYVRYFTFLDHFRSSNKVSNSHNTKNSILRKEVLDFLNGRHLPQELLGYFYAFVDPKNIRSLLLCYELGFKQTGSFTSFMFGRLFPKPLIDFQLANKHDQVEIRKLLSDTYQNHNAYSEENLFVNDYYLVRDINGTVIAGVQSNPVHWVVKSLAGKHGIYLLNLINKLPILNRLIRKDYRFLALDFNYCKSGHEQELESLIESILHYKKLYSALIVVDQKSPYHTIFDLMNKGIIHRIKKPTVIHTICKTFGLGEKSLKTIENRPTFISSYDTT